MELGMQTAEGNLRVMLTAIVVEFCGHLQSGYPNRLQPGCNCKGGERYLCTVARYSSKMFWKNMFRIFHFSG